MTTEEYIARINGANPGGDNQHLPFVQGGTSGGYLEGVGETVAPGRSMTRAQHERYYQEALDAGIPQDWLDDYLVRNPWDAHRAIEGYRSETTGSGIDQQTGQRGTPAGAASGGDWWSQNAPGGGMGDGGFGAAPEPFGEQYSTLTRPEALRQPYVAPQWEETFTEPTMEQVTSDQGYKARLMQGQRTQEASAAARGSILSGGHQKALTRFGQEFASNEYGAARGRAFDNYLQRYGQFNDSANRGVQARGINESAYQTDAANNLGQYNTRYRAYQDAILNRRDSERDTFDRNYSMARLGLDATTAGRPA
jgi:hypothetical protein